MHSGFWFIVAATVLTASVLLADEPQPRLIINGPAGSARRIAITPDDMFGITLGNQQLDGKDLVGDDGVRMWNLSTGEARPIAKLNGRALALSPKGEILALAVNDAVRLWSIPLDKEIALLGKLPSQVLAVAFSPDGKSLAAGCVKAGPKPGSRVSVATLFDMSTGKQLQTFESSNGSVTAVAFSPDGSILAVATQDYSLIGDVTLWDVATGKVHSTLPANGVDCIAFSPDSQTLAAGCVAYYEQLRDRQRDGKALAAGERGGKKEGHHVRLWDVGTAKDLHFLRQEGRVYCVAFSQDGKTVASGSEYAELMLWDTATGKLRVEMPKQSHYVVSLTFTKDHKTLVSTTRDGVIKCWELSRILASDAEK